MKQLQSPPSTCKINKNVTIFLFYFFTLLSTKKQKKNFSFSLCSLCSHCSLSLSPFFLSLDSLPINQAWKLPATFSSFPLAFDHCFSVAETTNRYARSSRVVTATRWCGPVRP